VILYDLGVVRGKNSTYSRVRREWDALLRKRSSATYKKISSPNFDLTTRNFDLPPRNFDLTTQNVDITTRNFDLPTRNFDQLNSKFSMVNHGTKYGKYLGIYQGIPRYILVRTPYSVNMVIYIM